MDGVTVVGSINMDLTCYLDRWPTVGETVTARQTRLSLGGKGANQAVAAARLGAGVSLIGAVGSDSFGSDLAGLLRTAGIDLHLNRPDDVATGMALIDVGPDGDNLIRLSPGANAALDAAYVRASWPDLPATRILLLQNEIPFAASMEAARLARDAGSLVIMDPAPAPEPFWSAEDLAAFDILTPNAHEAGILLGQAPATLDEALAAARRLREAGLSGCILTMGALGAAWSVPGSEGMQGAPKVAAIDTVGAGDCFNGALAAALSEGHGFEYALDRALRAAAVSTTADGASDSFPSAADLKTDP